jgi:hypothetical protein
MHKVGSCEPAIREGSQNAGHGHTQGSPERPAGKV